MEGANCTGILKIRFLYRSFSLHIADSYSLIISVVNLFFGMFFESFVLVLNNYRKR